MCSFLKTIFFRRFFYYSYALVDVFSNSNFYQIHKNSEDIRILHFRNPSLNVEQNCYDDYMPIRICHTCMVAFHQLMDLEQTRGMHYIQCLVQSISKILKNNKNLVRRLDLIWYCRDDQTTNFK